VLSGSELWLLRLMADRGAALLDASTLLMVVEERRELRVAASSGRVSVRVRVLPTEGSALGALYRTGKSLSLERPRGQEATWLHELGLEARAVLVEPFSLDDQSGGLVIAAREDGGFRDPDRRALNAFAASVAQRLAAERSVEIERLRETHFDGTRSGHNFTIERQVEPLVLESEISGLADLHAFMKYQNFVTFFSFPYFDMPEVAKSFELRERPDDKLPYAPKTLPGTAASPAELAQEPEPSAAPAEPQPQPNEPAAVQEIQPEATISDDTSEQQALTFKG